MHNRELVEDFLDSKLENFNNRLHRVLDCKPNKNGANKELFWAEFFLSMALNIQNTKLGEELKIAGAF